MNQMSIFDLIPPQQALIIYRDRHGVTHRERLTYYGDFIKAVGKWRDDHKDCYFIGTEQI